MKKGSPTLHASVAEYIDLCEPDRVYVLAETEEDRGYIRKAAIRESGEIGVATLGTLLILITTMSELGVGSTQ
jgi:GTP-dependent phosphoenolpyruvate carboxykinase